MNRIEKLIEEMCPEGVPKYRLDEVFEIRGGYTPSKSKSELWDPPEIPWFRMEDLRSHGRILDYSTQYISKIGVKRSGPFRANSIIISDTATIGEHALITVPFAANQQFSILELRQSFASRVDMKFAFYMGFSLGHYCRKNTSKGGYPTLVKTALNSWQFSVPPLEIQKEIVNILDKFTQLEVELEVELEAREKQYEEVRRRLLDFESDTSNHPLGEMIREMCPEGVETLKIGELAECFSGATPKSGTARYWKNGTIPWMSSGEVNLQRVFQTEKKISQDGYDSCSTRMVPKGSVLMALAGQGKTRGKVAINMIELCTNQSLCAIVTGRQLSSEYLYYWLSSKYLFLRSISAGEGGRGGLNLGLIRSIELPVPPLEIQQEIVRILDNLDSLVNSVNEGIPAEIAARRKQYEYYRDKLLTFKELDAA